MAARLAVNATLVPEALAERASQLDNLATTGNAQWDLAFARLLAASSASIRP
jgi:hypothetical protein